MHIREHVRLSDFTTLATGGPARYFCEVENDRDIQEAILFARENALPIFVLGNGSNLLISDAGFPGLVIHIVSRGIKIVSENAEAVVIRVAAGEAFDDAIRFAIERGYSGIENLTDIPGTAGAAVVQNIGAYGVEIKDSVESIRGIDALSGKAFSYANDDCRFGYRESIFKTQKNLIITEIRLQLSKTFVPHIDYPGLADVCAGKKDISAEQVRAAVASVRKSKLPDWRKLHTAGSFFKNPVVPVTLYEQLKIRYPELPHFPAAAGFVKIPLGYVLDKICGLKGFSDGHVGLYEKQALVLVNDGKGTAADIERLAGHAEQAVFEKTGIRIEREVEKVC